MIKLERIIKNKISRRTIEEGEYIVSQHSTIRATAVHFGVSKSTVHRDIRIFLEREDSELYAKVQEILETNKSERHVRGGEATRLKCKIKATESNKLKSEKNKKSISGRGHKENVRHKKAAI